MQKIKFICKLLQNLINQQAGSYQEGAERQSPFEKSRSPSLLKENLCHKHVKSNFHKTFLKSNYTIVVVNFNQIGAIGRERRKFKHSKYS